MPRNISLKQPIDQHNDCMQSYHTDDKQWLLLFDNQRACLHHVHSVPDDHLMCGPLVFCCRAAIEKFLKIFPDFDCSEKYPLETGDRQAEIRLIPAEQIITWMDAGIQVINFIVCDRDSDGGISAAILSGNQARQALNREIILKPYLSSNALNSMGQVPGLSEKE